MVPPRNNQKSLPVILGGSSSEAQGGMRDLPMLQKVSVKHPHSISSSGMSLGIVSLPSPIP